MSVTEASGARTPLGADLKVAVDAISYNQTIRFTKYVQLVLPLDGYVFWVRGDLVSPPAAKVRQVMGSLHYATDQKQEEAESYAVNRVIFTSEEQVDFLNSMASTELYIGDFEGLEFAFSSRKSFYRQAELWHYIGNAVYADMQPQLITSVDQLAALTLIASNSLPLWLNLNRFAPAWPFYPTLPLPFTLYPSFLNPSNLEPPWAAVHIGDDDTMPMVSTAGFNLTESQTQIVSDKVRVTLWGATNDQAMLFLATVNQYSYDTGLFGVMNRPVVRDAKRTQSELGTLAQKKIIDFEISYIQGRVANTARTLILGAIPTFIPGGYPNTNGHSAKTIGPFLSVAAGTVTTPP